MPKRNYRVFVSVNVAGTITVDARDGDDARDVVGGMGGEVVLDAMWRDDYDICADDVEENFDGDERY